MGGLEEAAAKIAGARLQERELGRIDMATREAKSAALLQEFLNLAQARRFPLDVLYLREFEGSNRPRSTYRPSGISGWVVSTTSGGESAESSGTLVTPAGALHRFNALRRSQPEHEQTSVARFYLANHPGVSTRNVYLELVDREPSRFLDEEDVTGCVATYLSGPWVLTSTDQKTGAH